MEDVTQSLLLDLDRNDELGTLSRIIFFMMNYYLKAASIDSKAAEKLTEIPLTSLFQQLLSDLPQGNFPWVLPQIKKLSRFRFCQRIFCLLSLVYYFKNFIKFFYFEVTSIGRYH
jgi:flagellar biosynthesis protein FlhB